MHSPMVFFETTPMGRVANRFSFDTEVRAPCVLDCVCSPWRFLPDATLLNNTLAMALTSFSLYLSVCALVCCAGH